MHPRGPTRWALACLAVPLAGCVAQIQETRLEGPPRPTVDARSEVITERGTAPDGSTRCRDVTVTAPMVRDVVLRRSFADDGQERNAALAMLLGAGMGALVFGAGQVQCSQGGACSAPTVAAVVVAGVALLPLAFIARNAAAVRDREVVEPVAPGTRPGAWRECPPALETRPPRP